jgi:predicted methyltransferase MtxX (methanogen marker protein 4)
LRAHRRTGGHGQHTGARLRDNTYTIVDALGAEVGDMNKQMRNFVEEQCGLLRAEIATLRGTVRAANQIAELKEQVENLQKVIVIDVPMLPMSGAGSRHEH